MSSDLSTVGEVCAEVVRRRLAEEGQRRTSLHARAAAVVSSSGLLTTLLFAVERAAETPLSALPLATRTGVGAALLTLLLACLLSVLASAPRQVHRLRAAGLHHLIDTSWRSTELVEENGRRRLPPAQALALREVGDLALWEGANDAGFRRLRIAQALEVLGVVIVAVVALQLLGDP